MLDEPVPPGGRRWYEGKEEMEAGDELLSLNKVAVMILSGGQGSRLGFDGPKGAFPFSPLQNKSLFRWLCEKIIFLNKKYSVSLPLLVMTSETNHAYTIEYFLKNSFFGLIKEDVHFFSQDCIPSVSKDGKLLLSDSAHLFVNPDGHGGCLKAIFTSGILEKLRKEGVTHIYSCQIDNPMARIADPVFLGMTAIKRAETATKVVRRMDTAEKVDNYIKSKYPSSPVTGAMIMNGAQSYEVDVRLMMAIMEQDSSFATAGKAIRTLNPGNVGNDDDGNLRTYGSWQEGVTAVAEWLSRHRGSTIIPQIPEQPLFDYPTTSTTTPTTSTTTPTTDTPDIDTDTDTDTDTSTNTDTDTDTDTSTTTPTTDTPDIDTDTDTDTSTNTDTDTDTSTTTPSIDTDIDIDTSTTTPTTSTTFAAEYDAIFAQRSRSYPRVRPKRKPAAYMSPAPVVSTAFTL